MEGGDEEEQQGIIPRTISKIFEETKCLVEKVKRSVVKFTDTDSR